MNTSTIVSTILSTMNGTLVRKGKENFIAIPNDEGGYIKVAVSNLLAKDTATNKAFDFATSVTEYAEWAKEQEAKANKPKATKPVNVKAQELRDAMDATITAWVPDMEEDKRYSATDIKNAIGIEADVMQVGSSAIRLADKGIIGIERDAKGKRFYFAL